MIRLFLFLMSTISVIAQTSFPKEEFHSRRQKLIDQIPRGIAIVMASQSEEAPIKYYESPDFFYFTGIEEPGAILVLNGITKKSYLFALKKDEGAVTIEGPGVWQDKQFTETHGLDLIDRDNFFTSLPYWMNGVEKIYYPTSSPDEIDKSRGEMDGEWAAIFKHPLFSRHGDYRLGAQKLREFLPGITLENVNPIIDKLRFIKTPYEIEKMRTSGKIGAEGVKEAIRGSKSGQYEYELEAKARYVFNKMGARDAFPPIVASGPNTLTIHYSANNRQMKTGEIVLMDYGSNYEYYNSDITRVWPVTGKFTGDEEKMYKCILEARAAIIGMMKAGVTINQMKDAGQKAYEKYGFMDYYKSWGRYVGHFIGLSVHDVKPIDNDSSLPAGAVFNVEPVVGNDKMHMRLEDTILITENGAENLTAGVPVELDEIYKLMKEKGIGQ